MLLVHLQRLLRLYPVKIKGQVLLWVRVAVRPEARLEFVRCQRGLLEYFSGLIPPLRVRQEPEKVLNSQLDSYRSV